MTIVIEVIVAAAVLATALVVALPHGRRMLLGWYVREVQQIEVAESPSEKIVTYPLA